ncbi:MAG: FecR family protein [Deltaproteobacteria bacterium]|nr:FecR family protein [Deltaproteobacteria bacterium]
MKKLIAVSSVLLITLIFSLNLFAQTGKLIIQKGKVKVISKNQGIVYDQPNIEIDVYESDEFHTYDDTRAEITLNNKEEVIQLYSATFLVLKTLDQEKSQLSLPIGKARFLINRISRQINQIRRFQVRTSNALIGVKGTDFIMQTSGAETSVMTIEGVVSLANIADPTKSIDVSKNQASRVDKSRPPSPPTTVTAETQQKIISQDKPAVWEGVSMEEPAQDTEPTQETESEQVIEESDLEEMTVLESLAEIQDIIETIEDTMESNDVTIQIIIDK